MKVDSSAQHRGRSSAVNLTAAAGMDGDARNRSCGATGSQSQDSTVRRNEKTFRYTNQTFVLGYHMRQIIRLYNERWDLESRVHIRVKYDLY
ncbi:hypothetical protein IRJ41_002934 [Triplophysa rosa]|uniref:Uncharacterized protein n=1 Tax=Triplophysa rosa TaxID=992332 RepID=A0A9W8C5P3_TRIRA|nr:hypothetical protein IRJ41_002934 [Triplophysa rosa]